MKIFREDSEYCSVFGVWHDGVRVERISQLGSSQSLESKRNQFHMWCDREISPGIGSYSLRDVNLNLPIQIVSSELIAVHSDDGLELPCHQVVFDGPIIL